MILVAAAVADSIDAERSPGGGSSGGGLMSTRYHIPIPGLRPGSEKSKIGPEIIDFGGLNGLKPVQNPFKAVGHEVPHRFK